MVLVDYPDSESDEDEPQPDNSGQHGDLTKTTQGASHYLTKQLPELPNSFKQQYTSNVRTGTVDDPSLHDGRQRQIPHVAGNWPSFVYLKWLPSNADLECLDQVLLQAEQQLSPAVKGNKAAVQTSLRSSLGVRLPLHVSLSSTLALTTENKADFERDLTRAVEALQLEAISLQVAQVQWFSNTEGSRSFLVLSFGESIDERLQALLSTCNIVAKKYGLPELYSDKRALALEPSNTTLSSSDPASKCHISIAWALRRVEPASVSLPSDLARRLELLHINFGEVLLKIGNQICAIPLT